MELHLYIPFYPLAPPEICVILRLRLKQIAPKRYKAKVFNCGSADEIIAAQHACEYACGRKFWIGKVPTYYTLR